MQHYIDQLIEDLEQVAKNPPKPSYFETPPHMEAMPDVSELAQTPYKTIEELTGIKQEQFPEMDDLGWEQWDQVNTAIFKVFDSLKLLLVDKPEDIPPETLYEVLTTNWKAWVQYLPLSGMDLELCTGDPWVCPYGEYCSCGNELEDEYGLSERFENAIESIRQRFVLQQTCYLKFDSGEVFDTISDTEAEANINSSLSTPKHDLDISDPWDKHVYFTITPPQPENTLEMMTGFAGKPENNEVIGLLLRALESTDPIKNFNSIIDDWDLLAQWEAYKIECIDNLIRIEIHLQINQWANFPPVELNGFYNDDETKVDP